MADNLKVCNGESTIRILKKDDRACITNLNIRRPYFHVEPFPNELRDLSDLSDLLDCRLLYNSQSHR